ncbi:MAG: hypothetical protein M3144_04305, partial [Actinomycetota bacterium]|nr:hypothetical protein [Actinomycetota bacterium]
MAGATSHYALLKLRAGENLSTNGYQFTNGDRDLIDALLAVGAELHRHTGAEATNLSPTLAPNLALDTSAGNLPAGARVYYKFSLVDPMGMETAASPEAFVETPAPLAAPAAPSLIAEAGGSLLPGNYYYVLSAYSPSSNQETTAPNPAYTTVVGTGKRIRLTFPSLPAGAAGWNIYRQKPGQSTYFYLTSVAAGPVNWTDSGAVAEDCDRKRPTKNTTRATNRVTVALPTALPGAGWTWKIYRTLTNANYMNSLFHHVVEETTDGSGIIRTSYVDSGGATSTGSPPARSRVVGSPSKVSLVSGAEVSGRLPVGLVQAFPYVVTFAFVGQQTVIAGTNAWVCEFPAAT